MKVLLLGGTRFMGHYLAHRLLSGGHAVTLLTRGQTPDPFGPRVERITVDRTSPALAAALAGKAFDATVDFVAFAGDDVRGLLAALGERAGHYVMISTGQVYLVREECPIPARESDYDGPTLRAPESRADRDEWDYGMGKRAAEDELVRAFAERAFPSTRLRIPMVSGLRDPYRRIERYLARLSDGGPVLLPDAGTQSTRHVYAPEVARTIAALLGDARTFGQAYNLAQDETPSLAEIVRILADLLGAPDRTVAVARAAIEAAGLDPVVMSPFSGRWMSFLDPRRAEEELGFVHTPLTQYLETIAHAYLAAPPVAPPPGYELRAAELALARA